MHVDQSHGASKVAELLGSVLTKAPLVADAEAQKTVALVKGDVKLLERLVAFLKRPR